MTPHPQKMTAAERWAWLYADTPGSLDEAKRQAVAHAFLAGFEKAKELIAADRKELARRAWEASEGAFPTPRYHTFMKFDEWYALNEEEEIQSLGTEAAE